MVFTAVSPVSALFWSIAEHVLNPGFSPEKCFENALRTHSPVPVLYSRKALKDTKVNGKRIKKGEKIMISPFIVNGDKAGIPYGYGHHTCLMKFYNQAVWPRFLEHFFSKYDVEVTDNLDFLKKPRQYQLSGSGAAYSRPTESFEVILTEKKSMKAKEE